MLLASCNPIAVRKRRFRTSSGVPNPNMGTLRNEVRKPHLTSTEGRPGGSLPNSASSRRDCRAASFASSAASISSQTSLALSSVRDHFEVKCGYVRALHREGPTNFLRRAQ
jgi:hypothetical protein